MRNELMRQLSTLPEETIIGVQIGDQHLDVTNLAPWGDEGFVDLQCHAADLRDVLAEWDLPAHKRERLVAAASTASTLAQRSVMTELLPAQESGDLQRDSGRRLLPGTPP